MTISTKLIVGWLRCLIGDHDYTCAAAEGIPPTARQKADASLFWEYAEMYCARKDCEWRYKSKT